MSRSTFLQTEPVGNAIVAEILCEQMGERETQIIQDEISAAAEPVGWRLAIDLSNVTFMPSAGLGMLVAIHNSAKLSKGKVAVFGVADDLMMMLKVTHLDKLFAIKPTREAAIKAVS
ncbi:MAG: hypothetical protein COB69_08875 [Phycisphaera sp.]|nr:MAG: hypothetical protein COB69_08875 [Phycisphaera sp.]